MVKDNPRIVAMRGLAPEPVLRAPAAALVGGFSNYK